MHNRWFSKPAARCISRWVTGTGVCLLLGALIGPSLLELLPVDGLESLVHATAPRVFRVVPAEPEIGYVRPLLLGLGLLLLCGGLLAKRKGR